MPAMDPYKKYPLFKLILDAAVAKYGMSAVVQAIKTTQNILVEDRDVRLMIGGTFHEFLLLFAQKLGDTLICGRYNHIRAGPCSDLKRFGKCRSLHCCIVCVILDDYQVGCMHQAHSGDCPWESDALLEGEAMGEGVFDVARTLIQPRPKPKPATASQSSAKLVKPTPRKAAVTPVPQPAPQPAPQLVSIVVQESPGVTWSKVVRGAASTASSKHAGEETETDASADDEEVLSVGLFDNKLVGPTESETSVVETDRVAGAEYVQQQLTAFEESAAPAMPSVAAPVSAWSVGDSTAGWSSFPAPSRPTDVYSRSLGIADITFGCLKMLQGRGGALDAFCTTFRRCAANDNTGVFVPPAIVAAIVYVPIPELNSALTLISDYLYSNIVSEDVIADVLLLMQTPAVSRHTHTLHGSCLRLMARIPFSKVADHVWGISEVARIMSKVGPAAYYTQDPYCISACPWNTACVGLAYKASSIELVLLGDLAHAAREAGVPTLAEYAAQLRPGIVTPRSLGMLAALAVATWIAAPPAQ